MDSNDQSNHDAFKPPAEPGTREETEQVNEIMEIVKLADSKTPSPDQRAMRVWDALKKSPDYDTLSTWDIVCFAGNGVAMFHTFHPWLEQAARDLAKLMNTIHYANWETIAAEESDVEIARLRKKLDAEKAR